MPIINRAAELAEDAKVWRRDFHQHPELLYEVHRTAARVAELLTSFGVDEVVTGIGRTGVVGVIRGREPSPRVIGLRADMDALPLQEVSDIPHKSTIPGRMHACGHDGHTAMLLGAARYLAETRNFAGTAVVIFQPAEEGGAGGAAAALALARMNRAASRPRLLADRRHRDAFRLSLDRLRFTSRAAGRQFPFPDGPIASGDHISSSSAACHSPSQSRISIWR